MVELTGGAGLGGAGGDSTGVDHHVLQGQQDVRSVLTLAAFIGTKVSNELHSGQQSLAAHLMLTRP